MAEQIVKYGNCVCVPCRLLEKPECRYEQALDIISDLGGEINALRTELDKTKAKLERAEGGGEVNLDIPEWLIQELMPIYSSCSFANPREAMMCDLKNYMEQSEREGQKITWRKRKPKLRELPFELGTKI